MIRSEWTLGGDGTTLSYDALVPANSEATLRLPAVWADSVREGRTPSARVDGVRFVGMRTAAATYRLPSGSYPLTSRPR